MTQLKIMEKKKRILPALILLILLLAAGVMFYMAVKEQLPYWVSDYRSRRVQEHYTNFDNADSGRLGGVRDTEKDDSIRPVGKISGDADKSIPQNWNGVDWNGLKKMNPDIIGWIRIPGLVVDYAILRGTSDDYYLKHHMDGSSNILGSIFASYGTSLALDDAHTILYGHNMASGRMFGQLSYYADVEFWKKYPYVYIYTPSRILSLAICSVYDCSDNDITYTLGYSLGSDDFRQWITRIMGKSTYKTEFIPTGDEQIFTLSTCADSGAENNRFLINCMVIREEQKNNISRD